MMSLVFFFGRTVCLTTCSSNNLGPLKHAVTLPTSLFMFHLASFTRHYIVHFLSNFLQPTLYCSCFILFSSVCSPSHSFRLTKSTSFKFTLFGYTHIGIHIGTHIGIQPYCQFHFPANSVFGNEAPTGVFG